MGGPREVLGSLRKVLGGPGKHQEVLGSDGWLPRNFTKGEKLQKVSSPLGAVASPRNS